MKQEINPQETNRAIAFELWMKSINENADPDVRVDMETIFNRLVPENRPEYEHTLEGADDMPAHAKSTLSGVSLTIPNSHPPLAISQYSMCVDFRLLSKLNCTSFRALPIFWKEVSGSKF